jgi:HD-like signal output (HDOD) protein
VNADYAEGAFVAGLLHDLGRLLIALGLPDEFGRLVKLHRTVRKVLDGMRNGALGITHANSSADALAMWKFTEEVQVAVRDHTIRRQIQPGGIVPLSAIIDAANRYINSTGESIVASTSVSGAEGTEALTSLGFSEEALGKLLTDFQAEHAAMAAFFK